MVNLTPHRDRRYDRDRQDAYAPQGRGMVRIARSQQRFGLGARGTDRSDFSGMFGASRFAGDNR